MKYTVDKTQKHPYLDGMYCLYKDWIGIGWVGENAQIGESAQIGKTVWIGENATICNGVEIGKTVWIGKDVLIEDDATICKGTVISDGAVIGQGVWIGDGAVIKYPYDYLTINAIGSRQDVTTFYRHQDGMIHVWCGCFNGTLDDFEEAVHKTHAGTIHERAYMAAIHMAKDIMIRN